MTLFAMSDLYLDTLKSGEAMLGPEWEGHHQKIKQGWRTTLLDDNDVMLIGGNIVSGRTISEGKRSLHTLTKLPGTKVIVRGSIDAWWPGSPDKLRKILPNDVVALDGSAIRIDDVIVAGGQGLDFTEEAADPGKFQKRLDAQRQKLHLSFKHAAELKAEGGISRLIWLLHYPPFAPGKRESVLTKMAEVEGVSLCLWGNKIKATDRAQFFEGTEGKITYKCIVSSSREFVPMKVE